MTVDVHLDQRQLEQLAEIIADKLGIRGDGELITAAELAKRIGRSREYVYEHSAAFGAVRLGDGHRPRLAFRWPHALDRLAELEEPAKRRRQPRSTATNRPRKQRPGTTEVELLPVRGRRS